MRSRMLVIIYTLMILTLFVLGFLMSLMNLDKGLGHILSAGYDGIMSLSLLLFFCAFYVKNYRFSTRFFIVGFAITCVYFVLQFIFPQVQKMGILGLLYFPFIWNRLSEFDP